MLLLGGLWRRRDLGFLPDPTGRALAARRNRRGAAVTDRRCAGDCLDQEEGCQPQKGKEADYVGDGGQDHTAGQRWVNAHAL